MIFLKRKNSSRTILYLFKDPLKLFKDVKNILYLLEEIHNGLKFEELEEILYTFVPVSEKG